MDTTPAAVKLFECPECGFALLQPSTMRWHCLSAHGKQWMGPGVALQEVTNDKTPDQLHRRPQKPLVAWGLRWKLQWQRCQRQNFSAAAAQPGHQNLDQGTFKE